MTEPDFCVLPGCLIPLGTEEPLWEWDVVSDAIFYSLGARKALNMSSHPVTMRELYQLLPQAAAMELEAMHEGIVSGKTGSMLECGYLCNGLWAKENLLIISRDESGRATRAIGRITASPVLPDKTVFSREAAAFPDTGVWAFHVPTGRIWRDKICADILGKKGDSHYPVMNNESILDVHPAERTAIKHHYDLFCTDNSLGDSITDLVRVRQANGTYTPMLVRASMAERDQAGRGVFIVGIVARCEAANPAARFLSTQNGIFNTLSDMGSGQWNWNTQSGAMYFCPRYLAMLGYDASQGMELSGNWRSLVHPDDLERVCHVRNTIMASPENGDFYECTYRVRKADSSWIWIFERGFVTWRDTDGKAGHMAVYTSNITTAQEDRERLEKLVRHDALTGLRSRAHCNLELEHLEQNKIRPVSIISVDITGLKMVNDNLGHLSGDEVLKNGAEVLRGTLRASDCIGRMGGDEFLVLLPNCSREKGEKLLRKIRDGFAAYNACGDHIPVFAACGLATAENMNESLGHTIARADDAMYHEKRQQRPQAMEVLRGWIHKKTGKKMIEDDRLV